MRIAVNTRFLLSRGLEGIGWYTHEVLRCMVEQHPEDEFLFLFDRPFDPKYVFGDNVETQVVFPPARHPFLWWVWFEVSLPNVLRKWKPDVFFSPDGYLSIRSVVPTVMVMHDLAYRHFPAQVPNLVYRYYEYYTPRFLQRAEEVLAVSEATRRDIKNQFGDLNTPISVAPNGVRSVFRTISEPEKEEVRQRYAAGDPYFFYVGAIHPRKNVARLIRAFDQFKRETGSKTRLLLAGRLAWQTGAVEEALRQTSYREHIHLVGYLDQEELRCCLAAARALTYVSLFEGFGVPLLEAMWTETPILTSQTSSMPEVAGDAGLLVDPTSEHSIAEGLRRLDQEPDLRENLVEKGLLQRTKYAWNSTSERVYDALLRVK
ncbi:MAG: glycosyltransferase family 1 protein [Bacteroidota bacterium]